MKVITHDAALGADVYGLDLTKPLSGDVVDELRKLFHERGVVAIRGQNLTPLQQVAFGRYFGSPEEHFLSKFLVPGRPELLVVSNVIENGRQIGLIDAGNEWHTDLSYAERPTYLSMLYALEVPQADGKSLGDTQFVSTAAAYESLDEAHKQKLEGKTAIHSYAARTRARAAANSARPMPSKEELDKVPDVEHPIVRRHPYTGRGCIFINKAYTTEIRGMAESESSAELEFLVSHISQPRHFFRHNWQPGDLLVWDNTQTQHLATHDYSADQRRRMHRVSLKGTVPYEQ